MTSTFFSIGHSTRSVAEFAELLQQAGAGFVVDVRAFPRSRANPQFNFDVTPVTYFGPYEYAVPNGLRPRHGRRPGWPPSALAR